MSSIKIFESQLRQLFASVVWTHKIQEKQADIYRDRFKIFEFWRIFLSALTASGIFAVIFIDHFWLKVCSSIISICSLFISIYYETNDLKSMAVNHKQTAIQLLIMREHMISVLTEIQCGNMLEEDLKNKLDLLYAEYFSICEKAPDASDEAVEKASVALKVKGDNTFEDGEIDGYLPIYLRKVGTRNE